VTELVLTAERRNELAELLDDEERLRTEYPKVNEYLDTGLRLPGTGDERADRAFDLRLVHYMTGGSEVSSNPYWEIVAPSVCPGDDGRRIVNGGRPDGSARLGYAEILLQGTYAYAIPSPETIEWVAQFSEGRPLVELGAGRGYWAAQLAKAGLTVEAYDSEPPGKAENVSFPGAIGQRDVWYHVGDSAELAGRKHGWSNCVLFLCWPPGWGNTMASEALAEFESAGGSCLIFIGEPQGGKTGDDAFFDALRARWELESEDGLFVTWWNLADEAQGWVRRSGV